MAARLFQSILLEVKDNVDFILGVVDNTGVITACTELKFIGESIEAAVEFFKMGLEEGQAGGYTFHMIGGYEAGAENAVFAGSIGERATLVCALTAVAIKNSKTQYDEKHDKVTFIKKIILDNILPGDIYIKSREMHFVSDCKRVAYSVRMEDRQDAAVMEALVKLFPDRQKDFVITISESEIALIKELKNGDAREVSRIAEQMDKALDEEVGIPHVIGIGSVVGQLKDIARSFKEAQIAVDVGHVFNEDKTVMNFENLGIGRLIYQLPTTLCEMFLSEVFKKGSIDSLDEETLFTIQKFFENNLNVSETSRKLFVHRNTLVYRLEKIKKLTGLDLREFDNAIVLKVALRGGGGRTMIKLVDAYKTYDNGTKALNGVNLEIADGEFAFIVGPSGSGKSTMMKLLIGEIRPTSGKVYVNDFDLTTIKNRQLPYMRRTVGVVFQDFRLIDKKTVFENVAFVMRAVGTPPRIIKKRVPYVLDLVGVLHKARRHPDELSGGEQQRVAIARALVNNPSVIIADEPTGNLDPARSLELMTLLGKINALGTTVLVVTHEKELVNQFGKRVISIDRGQVVGDHTGGYYDDLEKSGYQIDEAF